VVLRDDAPRGWWVIDEFVLSRRVGSAKITYDALTHLAAMSRRPRITLQVLADGEAYVGLGGAFSIAERMGARTTVFLQDIVQGSITDDGATVAIVSQHFRWMQAEALSPQASTDFIERMAEEKWSTP
jgi:hypothetical protein